MIDIYYIMYILLIVYYIIVYKKIKIKKDYLINYIKELQLKNRYYILNFMIIILFDYLILKFLYFTVKMLKNNKNGNYNNNNKKIVFI